MTEVLRWGRYSAFIPAVLAAGLALSTFEFLALTYSSWVLAVIFLGSFGIYQTDRVLSASREDLHAHPSRSAWTSERKWFLAALAVAAMAGATAFALLRLQGRLLLLGFAAVPGLLYALSLGKSGWRLKDVAWCKPVLVAGTWCAVVVGVPAASATTSGLALSTIVVYRFFYLLTNVLLCEIVEARRCGLGQGSEATLLMAARFCALASLGAGLVLAFSIQLNALVMLDMVGVSVLLLLTAPLVLRRLTESDVVDVVTLWPVLVALAHSFRLG